jgi:hypothetical protein
MSSYRVVLVSLAAVFTVGMTSLASAGGWGWGGGWGGGWGAGCGGCAAPTAAIVYAQPVIAAPPLVTVGWGGGCGCGQQSIVYAAPPIEPTPIAPAPIYVVNQGPAYEGPGITVPYHTWAPVSGYGPVGGYGYHHHFGYGYGHRWGYGYRPHLAYHRPFIGYPHRRWPMPYGHGYPWNK